MSAWEEVQRLTCLQMKPSEVTYFQIFGEIIHNNWWSERETGLLHFLQVVKKNKKQPSWDSRLLPITGRLTPKVQLMSKAKESNNLISLEKNKCLQCTCESGFHFRPVPYDAWACANARSIAERAAGELLCVFKIALYISPCCSFNVHDGQPTQTTLSQSI